MDWLTWKYFFLISSHKRFFYWIKFYITQIGHFFSPLNITFLKSNCHVVKPFPAERFYNKSSLYIICTKCVFNYPTFDLFSRLAFYEFINNEDVRRMFVFIRPPRQIIASLQPPHDLKYKSIFFLKSNTGTKITKDNISESLFSFFI